MAKEHVHARIFERSVAQQISKSRGHSINWPKWVTSPYLRLIVVTLLWGITIGLTLLLFSYLKMTGVILLVLMFASLVAHEAGHYFEMKKAGVPVEEVGIGIPYGIFRLLQYEVLTGRLPFRLKISPVWVAFYVDEGESGKPVLDELDYQSKVRIFAAGPTVNLVLFLVLISALPVHASLIGAFQPDTTGMLITSAAAITAWLIFKWWFPEKAHILSPLMGVGVLALLVTSLWGAMLVDPVQATTNGGSLAGEPPAIIGPVSMVQMMAQGVDPFGGQLGNSKLLIMHGFIAVLNFGLAATNFLPIKWFDGGQIWGAVLDEKVGKSRSTTLLNWSTVVVFTPLVIVLTFSELSGLWSWLLIGVLLLLVMVNLAEKRLSTVNECIQTCST